MFDDQRLREHIIRGVREHFVVAVDVEVTFADEGETMNLKVTIVGDPGGTVQHYRFECGSDDEEYRFTPTCAPQNRELPSDIVVPLLPE